jgi:hypothetical protein
MKPIHFILLLAIISFNCQKELSPENIPALVPSITTATTTSITNTTALSGGNITDDGGATITARGVCWATTANPVATGNHTTDGTGSGIFTSNITGLTANTTYHVRAYATNSTGTSYGGDSSFTTTNSTTALPTVTTSSITAIAITTATGGGNVTADGGATVTARGVCWATTANPVATGNHTTDGTGTSVFTSSITGLTAGTVYHVRAYATNSVGTAYGGDSVFTTATTAVLPTVTTASINSITATSAAGGGNVSSDGGATVTARGVCWSTTANPVAAGNHTTDGSGTGIFTSAITGLATGITYHVRAYATNSVGTAYGGDSVFTTTGGSGTQIKRIIQSVTGTRQAYITTLTYDASNRLLTFKEWEEDSSFTPIKISGANYSSLTYNGSGPYPVKNTITHEVAGVDSTIYSYDASNRVIEENYYYNGHVSVRNTYSYLSSTMVVLGKYILTSPGPALHFQGNDSLVFDTQQRITGYNSGNASNVPNGGGTYLYDNKNNPFALIDFFKHAFTLYCDDAKYFYRAPNNLTMFQQSTLPSGGINITSNYLAYNSGSFPLYATASLTHPPGPAQNFTMKFEYY